MNVAEYVGKTVGFSLAEVGAVFLLLGSAIKTFPKAIRQKHLVVEQMLRVGIGSLPLVLVTSILTGGVAAVQAAYQFQDWIPLRYVGSVVGKSVIIELGPVLTGLVVGEAAGIVTRRLNRVREIRLARFKLPESGGASAVSRKLDLYHAGSLGYTFVVEAAVIAAALPLSLLAAGAFTGFLDDPFVSGARWWMQLLPAFGAAAVIQLYWHRHTSRFLVVAAAVILVILWVR